MKMNRGVAKKITVATTLTGAVLALPTLASAHFGDELLQKGSHGAHVKNLQTVLKNENYYKLSTTGYFGKSTEKAVQKFQEDHELKVDGIVGPKTKGKLKEYVKYDGELLGYGSQGNEVKDVQNHLEELGYYKANNDGIYGKLTRSAVETFQNVNQLKVDGIVGPKTFDALHDSPEKAPENTGTSKTSSQSSEKQEVKETSRSKKVSSAKVLYMNSTAYTAYCSGCSGVTATGINLRSNPDVKVVAVDPDVIPLGTKLYIDGYGYAVAGDTGGAINGNRIDIFMADRSDALQWGRKTVKVRILK